MRLEMTHSLSALLLLFFVGACFSEQLQNTHYCSDARDCCRKYAKCLDVLIGQGDRGGNVTAFDCPVPKCRIGYEYLPFPDSAGNGRCIKYDQSLTTSGLTTSYTQEAHQEYQNLDDCRRDMGAGGTMHCFEGYWSAYRGCFNGMQLR